MIARHDGHTKAVVDGWCCSIATQIFFAADEREMPENAYLMIHKPMVGVYGNAFELQKTVDILNTIQEGLESTYRKAAKDGIADDYITDMVNDETWLTGAQASEIFNINVTGAVEAVACAGKHPLNFKKAPTNIRFAARDKPPEEKPVEPAPTEEPVNAVDNTVNKCRIAAALALAKGALK
jgi:hypothetical protein